MNIDFLNIIFPQTVFNIFIRFRRVAIMYAKDTFNGQNQRTYYRMLVLH